MKGWGMIEGLDEDWMRIGGLDEDWMRIGGGLEAYLCRSSIVGWMWMDRICPSYALGWPSYAPLYADYAPTSLKNVPNL